MQVKSVSLWDHNLKKQYTTHAELLVPGLGDVKITNCLSVETINRIVAETEVALQNKLSGRAIVCSQPQSTPAVPEVQNV